MPIEVVQPNPGIISSAPSLNPQTRVKVSGRGMVSRRKTIGQKPNTRSERLFTGFNPYIGTEDRRVHLFETYVGKAPVGTTGRDLIPYFRGNKVHHILARRDRIRRVHVVANKLRNRLLPNETASPDMVPLSNSVFPSIGSNPEITSQSDEPKFLSASLFTGKNFVFILIAGMVLLYFGKGR